MAGIDDLLEENEKTEEKKVVVQGLDGYIVAEKDNQLIVCKLSEEQRIRLFAEE